MTRLPLHAVVLITTHLAAFCFLSGCDGAQITQPAAAQTGSNGPLGSLSEAERKYVGVWTVDLPRFAENIKKQEDDKSRPISGVAYAMGHSLAPLTTVVIEPDRSANYFVGRRYEGKWTFRKNFVQFTDGKDFASAFKIGAESNVLHAYPESEDNWMDRFIQVSPPSERENATKLDGKWVLNAEKTNSLLDTHRAAVKKYGKPDFPYPWMGSPVDSFNVPLSSMEFKGDICTLQIGNASVTHSFQRKHTVMLFPDAIKPTDSREGGLDPMPFIVIGRDELVVQPIWFPVVRDAITMDSKYREVNYWTGWMYFKRDITVTPPESNEHK